MIHPRGLVFGNFVTAVLRFGLAVVVCLAAVSCAGSKGKETRYELKGSVVSVDRAEGRVVVDHEEIPGFMEAMRMPFSLPDRDAINSVEAGDRIQATLVVTDRGYWLENPILTKQAVGTPSADAGPREPQPGAEVPDFSLVNQDGKRISLKQQQGRALLVTFIYTRCPFADQCPLMSGNFAEVNRELEKDAALRSKAHLLSVTLDPEFDKPEVLRSYGAGHTQKYGNEKFDLWEFATGDPAEVRRMAEYFGVMYANKDNQIVHSLRTALITPDGKLHKVYRGNEWKPAEVLNDLKTLIS
jgi:protein SCO1/2